MICSGQWPRGSLAVVSISWFFHLLARGNMALTAPLTALTYAIVPVLFGFITIGWPKDTQLAGIGIALLAIPLMAQGSSNVRIENIWRHSLRLLGAPHPRRNRLWPRLDIHKPNRVE